ncbi:hypothetical protein E1B28_013249 [Marasmius oreades]|uniref:SET domain-containing protein n=1 Tax=Marasmius oreades TaxID=181124 RepID=A0A9P7RPG4_9AGAR|nr:uncharacterized protein E1B28_013249 [Marasmius oreades]KAG7087270.1 hypothetical protein E1B28_013249 [Marasmius oreades]
MLPSSPTRRRRSSSIASILQPLQINTSPQRSPKRSHNRRKSESSEGSHRRQRRVSFTTPISNTHRISNHTGFSSASHDVCIQTISFTTSASCVTLLEREAVASIPSVYSNPQPSSNPYQVSLCHSDTDQRSAEYGVFATRKIPRGGAVLVERPVMLVSSNSLAGCNIDQLLDSKVREAVLRLTDAHAKSAEGTLEGIMKTNGLEIEIGSTKCISLFLDMSRVNHSCGPNAMWRWDPSSFSITLEAVRPISEGSEITIPYIDCLQSRAERRKQLKALYNFDCYCQYCDVHWSEPNASVQSDLDRKELLEFSTSSHRVPSFESWYADKNLPDDALIELHLWALETRAKEGLELFAYKKHIDVIAMCFGALEDVENFRCWTERARNARMEEKTESEIAVLETWIQDPRMFPVWGWRRRALAQ